MVEYLKPTDEMVRKIASDMRQSDLEEVWASHRWTPLQAMLKSVEVSDYSTAIVIDGELCGIFGLRVDSYLSGRGLPWMLTSNNMINYKRDFILKTRPVIDQMMEVVPYLENYVHAKNKLSIRWLKWVGFTVEQPEPVGYNGELFHKFHITKGG